MATKLTKEQREEALAKVAEVLDEALAEYEALEKMDLELAEDPTRPVMSEDAPEEDEEEKEDDKDEAEEAAPEASEEDDKDEDEEEEESPEEDDEALKSEYAAVVAKMEARGLMKKSEEPKAEEVKKTEEAPKEDASEALRKSVDERFEGLTKAIEAISATVAKIAAQPAPKKGLSGVTPLKKNEEEQGQALNKAEVVNKLLDLKKSGKQIPTALFARIETNRTTDEDVKFIKGILG